MMAFHNAQERDEAEYIALFNMADQRFHFVGSSQSFGSFVSLLEFEFRTV
jgi:hypothetical protein